jgi:hypothetical protein
MTMNLVGRTFSFDLGPLKVNFTRDSDSHGTFEIEDGGGMAPDGHIETVELDTRMLREGLYLSSWTEASGDTVTQVEDYVNGKVYPNLTVQGVLHNLEGTITEK